MKCLAPALLLLACGTLSADVVIEQETKGPNQSELTKMKIKGDRARIDTQKATGNVTVLIDQTGKMVTYVHQSKMALITTMTDAAKTAKTLVKKTGTDTAKPDPLTKTGESEKVGAWNCEVWVHHTPSVTHKEWRTRDVPNLKRIQEQLTVLASAPGMAQDQALQSDTYTVKTERSDAKGATTMIVRKITEETVPDTDFTPPQGYREIPVPAQ
jgi:hypothetical protein